MSALDYIEGAVDLHVHSAPDVDPRRYDDIDLACEAARAGMSALLIKSHQSSTVERAYLTSKAVKNIRVFGGIVLNEPVGGLNPAAVRVALQLGAKEVWMPTRSALNHCRQHNLNGGISVLTGDGDLKPEAIAILEQVAAADCILGTGHLSAEESVVLIRHARRTGVRKILITHPEWSVTFYSCELQKQLAAEGCFFERCFVSTTHRCGYTPLSTIERAITDVGVESTILSTDLGQPDTPPPAEGFSLYAGQLRAAGVSRDQLRRMMCDNPRQLLSL